MDAAKSTRLPFSVTGKTAIITGAGSGINLCFAKLLLERKCNVVFADIALRPEAQSTVDKYSTRDNTQARAVFVKTDVTDWDALTNMFDVAEREFGSTDIVCAGAGVFEPHWSNFWHPPGTAESKDPVHGSAGVGHYATLDINLTHPIRTTQLALSRWLHAASGSSTSPTTATTTTTTTTTTPSSGSSATKMLAKRIVHVSSVAAQGSGLGVPLYATSKAALSTFVRCMGGLDAEFGIRVTAVAPGIIRTPLWTEHPEKLSMFNAERDVWIEPEDVAAQMLRCCEDSDIPGGCVLEVLKGATRPVQALNDPGPSGVGASVSNLAVLRTEALGWLGQPGWGAPV